MANIIGSFDGNSIVRRVLTLDVGINSGGNYKREIYLGRVTFTIAIVCAAEWKTGGSVEQSSSKISVILLFPG